MRARSVRSRPARSDRAAAGGCDLDDDDRPVGLSCHKAFHAQIPLSHAEVRQARALVERLEFDAVATPFEFAAPVSAKQVLALFDRQLAGQPVAGPVPLSELA